MRIILGDDFYHLQLSDEGDIDLEEVEVTITESDESLKIRVNGDQLLRALQAMNFTGE